ncbi:MAG: MFS transporter [Salinisphaeraceae bacterium]
MTGYARFLYDNRRLLTFGVLLCGLSGSGQTYLVALFGPALRAEFDLGNAAFGGLYSTATLASGLLLLWAGALIDRMPLARFTTLVIGGAAVGALLLAASPAWWVAGLALFLLRLCGQGLMTHLAQTSMARYFEAGRGKALGLAALGLPLGEAVFPLLVVAGITLLGWRMTWLTIAAILLASLPLLLALIRQPASAGSRAVSPPSDQARDPAVSWRRQEVLRDPRFYAVLAALLAPPFIVTGLFIHQASLAAAKGWTLSHLAQSFVFYAGGHVLALIAAGPLVDRFRSALLLPVMLGPMALAVGLLSVFEGDWLAPVYLGLAGLTVGGAATLFGAIWPRLYGVRHLGAIRAVAQAAMVLATAMAPALIGALLDQESGWPPITATMLVYLVVTTALAAAALGGGR